MTSRLFEHVMHLSELRQGQRISGRGKTTLGDTKKPNIISALERVTNSLHCSDGDTLIK